MNEFLKCFPNLKLNEADMKLLVDASEGDIRRALTLLQMALPGTSRRRVIPDESCFEKDHVTRRVFYTKYCNINLLFLAKRDIYARFRKLD